MQNITRDTFLPLFEDHLHLSRNAVCKRCDPAIKNPLLPWIVGERFSDTAERIMFVGKPHRGRPGDTRPSGVIDPTETVAEELWNTKWAYWSYTREIAEHLYGPQASDYIAFTNLVKCTNVDADAPSSADATTNQMAQCCVSELGVIWTEVEQLQPFTIVFYTYSLFRDLLNRIPVALEGSVKEVTPKDHYVRCGKKSLPWWERACATPWTKNLRVLVTGHPERMARSEYVGLLKQWLRPNQAMPPTTDSAGNVRHDCKKRIGHIGRGRQGPPLATARLTGC